MEKFRLKVRLKASKIQKSTEDKPLGGNANLQPRLAATPEGNSSSAEGIQVTSETMKRKRGPKAGDKKGKHKELVLISNDPGTNTVSLNMEDDSGFNDIDDDQLNSATKTEAHSSGPNKLNAATNTVGDGLNDRPVGQSGYGRVKVKLRSSKMLETQHAFSDSQTRNEMVQNNVGTLEKHSEIMEKKEDGMNLLPDTQATVSGNYSRKAGTVKIKSSRTLGSSSVVIHDKNNPKNCVHLHDDRSLDSSTSRNSHQRQTNVHQDHRYNEEELIAALAVIKKIMKMDAAEPFNVPVNPVALGIPDYFDIIDTPMDFGTICNNLQHGNKYMNSEDVYRDVQFIWENCNRYNNKGDYIVDLMKRVKKNFTKHWVAAGLYCDPPKWGTGQLGNTDAALDQDSGALECWSQEDGHERDKTLEEVSRQKTDLMLPKQETHGAPSVDKRLNGSQSNQSGNAASSSQEKLHVKHVKSNSSKQKMRRRHGINHHKSDCLCAVCVVRRRRKEREGNAQLVESQNSVSDGNLTLGVKEEDNSMLYNPYSEDGSPNLEHSLEPDADADMEEPGEEFKLENIEQEASLQPEKLGTTENDAGIQKKGYSELSEQVLLNDGTDEDSNQQSQRQEADSGLASQLDGQKDNGTLQQRQQAACHSHQLKEKQGESLKKHNKTKMLKDPPLEENSSVLRLCRSLFPDNPRSVWSGPHSLIHRHVPGRGRDSSIHAAVSMFMK